MSRCCLQLAAVSPSWLFGADRSRRLLPLVHFYIESGFKTHFKMLSVRWMSVILELKCERFDYRRRNWLRCRRPLQGEVITLVHEQWQRERGGRIRDSVMGKTEIQIHTHTLAVAPFGVVFWKEFFWLGLGLHSFCWAQWESHHVNTRSDWIASIWIDKFGVSLTFDLIRVHAKDTSCFLTDVYQVI